METDKLAGPFIGQFIFLEKSRGHVVVLANGLFLSKRQTTPSCDIVIGLGRRCATVQSSAPRP